MLYKDGPCKKGHHFGHFPPKYYHKQGSTLTFFEGGSAWTYYNQIVLNAWALCKTLQIFEVLTYISGRPCAPGAC